MRTRHFVRSGKMPIAMGEEDMHQFTVVQWLRANRVTFCHVPNGGKLGSKNANFERVRLKMLGLESGVPDLLIFDTPPAWPEFKGVAIEMKSLTGRTTENQDRWLDTLRQRGWKAFECKGQDAALQILRAAGYGK